MNERYEVVLRLSTEAGEIAWEFNPDSDDDLLSLLLHYTPDVQKCGVYFAIFLFTLKAAYKTDGRFQHRRTGRAMSLEEIARAINFPCSVKTKREALNAMLEAGLMEIEPGTGVYLIPGKPVDASKIASNDASNEATCEALEKLQMTPAIEQLETGTNSDPQKAVSLCMDGILGSKVTDGRV